jgi:hypothetical protein
MRLLATASAALLGVFVLTSNAQAGLVRYEFTTGPSVLTENSVDPSGSLLVGGDGGRPISGYFVVDIDLASASKGEAGLVFGYGSIVEFGLTSPLLNGLSFPRAIPGVNTGNEASSRNGAIDTLGLRTPLTGYARPTTVQLIVRFDDPTTWSAVYPTGSIDVLATPYARFNIYAIDNESVRIVSAPLTTLTGTDVTPAVGVPDAGSTLLLLGPALAGLLALRRRF